MFIIWSFTAPLFSFQPARKIIKQVLDVKHTKQPRLFIKKATESYISPVNVKKLRLLKKKELDDIAPLLIPAIWHLHDTPGFSSSLHVLLLSLGRPEAKGYAYELKKAFDIHTNPENEEQVTQINGKLPIHNQEVYIDVWTTKRIIECKALHWSKKPTENNPISSKLCSQFLRQKKGTEILNNSPCSSFSYEVHSLFDVPNVWKEWFDKNDIALVEEKK